MDWNALKNKTLEFGNKAAEKAYGAMENASGHLYEGLKKGPFSIKNGSEFDAFKSFPFVVVLAVGKDDAASKSIIARVPILYKDAWVCSAKLKVILSEEVPDLVAALDIKELPAAIVYRKGEIEKRFEGVATLDFVKNFDLSRPKSEAAPVPEGMTDVIAEAAAGTQKSVSTAAEPTTEAAPAAMAPAPVVESAPAAPALETPVAQAAPTQAAPETPVVPQTPAPTPVAATEVVPTVESEPKA